MGLKVIKLLAGGAAWGCTVNALVALIGYGMIGNEWFTGTGKPYPLQVAAAVLVGIAFSLPSIVYESERISKIGKVAIHMGIGFLVFLPTAYFMGWMPLQSVGFMASFIGLALFFSFLIMFAFYIFYKKEAEEINKKIKEKMQ